jgi:glycosyltransferase involved in cell wall biosynthesis
MRVILCHEHRYCRAPDGTVWTDGGSAYGFLQNYLTAFEELLVVARVKSVAQVPERWVRVDGPGVSVAGIPYYLGPVRYLLNRGRIRRAMRQIGELPGAIVLRAPGQLSEMLYPFVKNRPYGVEVVGDPRQAFSRGAVAHPLRPFFAYKFARGLSRMCRDASIVRYVTKHALQQRYPARPGVPEVAAADGDIGPEFFVAEPRRYFSRGGPRRVVFVGSLEQLYKGPDVLLHALALARKSGVHIAATLVGGGKHLDEMRTLASHLGVADLVEFTGHLSNPDAVRAQLDAADLFVMPSRTEGMPRAMIEAMARGLPCIGTCVGGIPELLDPADLVPPGDAEVLSELLKRCITDPARLEVMSQRNLLMANDYRRDVLLDRRAGFYRELRAITEAWATDRGAGAEAS